MNDFQFSKAGNNIFINPAAQSEALIADIAGKFPTVFPQTPNVPSLMWNGGGYDNIWHEGPWVNNEDLWSWKDDFSKVVGNHDLKFGGLYSWNVKDEQLGGGGGGNTPGFITGNGSKTGHAIADLLDRNLTLTNYQETDHTGLAQGRWHDVEFYGNDTWKFRPTVTLTLGLRYSQYHTADTANDQISNMIPQFYDGVSFNSALITPATAGAHGLSSSLTKPYNLGFQPRVGLAWDVFGDGKTALRMGFGRYMSRTNVIEDIVRMASNPPWTKIVDSGWSGAADTLAGCPTCRTMDAVGPNLKNQVQGVSNTSTFAAVDTDFRPPESYQWNLTVSREVMKNTVLEASYIGNHGLHIWRRNVNWNDVPANVPCKGGAAVGCDPAIRNDARFQIATLASKGLDTGPMVAANRRIPTLSGITMAQSTGNSSYHGLQLWLNRRFSDRLAYQAAYTWSHAISDVPLQAFTNSTTDPFDYTLDKGDSDLDRRHTFVSNVVYQLPAFTKRGAAFSQILGDWQLNGILSYYGGTPIDVLSGYNTYGTAGNVNPRPNLVLGVDPYLHTSDKTEWLNPAAFSLPGVGQLGSLGKGSIRGRSTTNVDFSIAKNWRFKERYGVQFRGEMFNVFNHTNFSRTDAYQNGLNFQGNSTLSNFGQPTNGGFGTIGRAADPREIQFGFKFTF